jgi:hypothetical protein
LKFALVQKFFAGMLGATYHREPGIFKLSTTIKRGLLHSRTLELVKNAPRHITYTDMAKNCGVSISWVSRFAAEQLDHPSVNIVECLHDYLVSVS